MPVKIDGTALRGTRVITVVIDELLATTVDYICDSFNVDQPTQFLEHRNQLNQPTGGIQDDDFITGSAVLQLNSDVTLPKNGDFFDEAIHPDEAAIRFYISNVGTPEEKAGLKKVNINFRKEYNYTPA